MSSEDSIRISSTLSEGPKEAVTCLICRRQFSKYTCPSCNVPYCSLTCFRSQAHNQCSEGFYKKEIETDIHAEHSKTAQERQQMMELLKKFEDEASEEQGFGEDDDDDDDPSELARRFETVDLDSVGSDELWSMLTAEERNKFMKAFDNPTGELAKQLLSSEQLGKEIQEPWWEDPTLEGENENTTNVPHRYGIRPHMMSIPDSMINVIPSGHPLVYNMCAICITYAYITRHLGTSPLGSLKPADPEYQASRRLVTQLVPFLTDRKSTQLYPDLQAVIIGIWSLLDIGEMTNELVSVLLRDAAHLLKPLRVTQVASPLDGAGDRVPQSSPHSMPILVLSDLSDLFSNRLGEANPQASEKQLKVNHISHKLRFYVAHILSTPSAILHSAVEELLMHAQVYGDKIR